MNGFRDVSAREMESVDGADNIGNRIMEDYTCNYFGVGV